MAYLSLGRVSKPRSNDRISVSWTYALLLGSPFFALILLVLLLQALHMLEPQATQPLAIALFLIAGTLVGLFGRWTEQRRIVATIRVEDDFLRIRYPSGKMQSISLASIRSFKTHESRLLGGGLWSLSLQFKPPSPIVLMGMRLRELRLLMKEDDAHDTTRRLSTKMSIIESGGIPTSGHGR